jgi:hypothetical protein
MQAPPKVPARWPRWTWLLGFFALAEGGVRLSGWTPEARPKPGWAWSPEDEPLAPDELHQRDARELWSPRPGAPIEGCDGETINAAGYRGPLLAPWRDGETLRIAVLGDASAFGSGVCERETFSALLVRELEQSGVRAEAINAGVPDFSLEQALVRYRKLLRPLQPDVVLLATTALPDQEPAPICSDAAKLKVLDLRSLTWPWLSREPVLPVRSMQWLGAEVERLAANRESDETAARVLEKWRQRSELPPEESGSPDWLGVRRVDLPRFEECLRTLAAWTRADDADLWIVALPRKRELEAARPVLLEYSARLERATREEGALWCDPTHGEIDELLLDSGALSARGHERVARGLMANGLAQFLRDLPRRRAAR